MRGGYHPPAGCIIATFNEDGQYANATDGSSHAAILLFEEVNGLAGARISGSRTAVPSPADIFQERGRRRVRRRGSALPLRSGHSDMTDGGKSGLLASVSDKLITVLPPAFLLMLLPNLATMGVVIYVVEHNTEARNVLLTKIIDSCLPHS